MENQAKIEMLKEAKAIMESSKVVCLEDAQKLLNNGDLKNFGFRIEKAAQYAWGFWRPQNW